VTNRFSAALSPIVKPPLLFRRASSSVALEWRVGGRIPFRADCGVLHGGVPGADRRACVRFGLLRIAGVSGPPGLD